MFTAEFIETPSGAFCIEVLDSKGGHLAICTVSCYLMEIGLLQYANERKSMVFNDNARLAYNENNDLVVQVIRNGQLIENKLIP